LIKDKQKKGQPLKYFGSHSSQSLNATGNLADERRKTIKSTLFSASDTVKDAPVIALETSRFGPARLKRLLALFDHPEEEIPIIHVAGTNGKGSTAALLAVLLSAVGWRVGLYTSPHIRSYSERFRLLDAVDFAPSTDLAVEPDTKQDRLLRLSCVPEYWLPEALLNQYIKEIKVSAQSIERSSALSLFETLTAVAYRWFAALHCDVAIIETGLGGELDGTNIVDREKIAVLTAIGYDHRKLLGNSLKTIAEAKVGIVTPTTVHAFAQDPSLLKEKEADRRAVKMVITQHCAEKNVPVTFVSPTLVSSFDSTNLGRYTLAVAETGHTIEVPLVGSHQAINTALAVEVAMWVGRNRWLGESKLMTEINNLNQAQEYVRTWQGVLQTFRWPGRFTLCCTDPALYFDGAHNPSGVREMCHTLATLYPGKKVNLVLGVLEDKDWQDICDIILTENHFTWHNIYCVTPPSERALDGQKLQSYLINLSGSMSNSYNELNVVVYKKLIEGILAARDHSLTTSEPVIICGSLYMLEIVYDLKDQMAKEARQLEVEC
jgi:dihydrofolate synthase/folylpolyglutamate synthase